MALVLIVLALTPVASARPPAPPWAGPPLTPDGWTGLGLYDAVWAAYRRPVAQPPAGPPQIWERIEYPATMSDLGPVGYRSSVSLLEVDCGQGSIKVMQWTTYVGNNLSGGVAGALADPGKPAYVIPGSIDDDLRRIACRGR